MRSNLAQYIQKHAVVVDHKIGFVSIEAVNQRVDPLILKRSAEITKGLFLDNLPTDLKPDAVLGVPNRGREFATALGIEAMLPVCVTERFEIAEDGKKDFRTDYSDDENIITINGIPSFTKRGKYFRHQIRSVKPGSTVLVADDFSATGTATDYYLRALNELDINPVFVYMVAKDFGNIEPPQQGYRRNKEKGVPVFSVVILKDIEDGRVKVSSEDIIL